MAKQERPLKVELPTPADERPAWSRVGVIAAAGFLLGIAWPRLAGVKIGPNVPGDLKTPTEATAAPATSAAPTASAAQAPAPPTTAAPTAAPEAPAPANKETVVIGPGKIVKCWDKKNKKVSECGELQLDPVAVPKLKALSECTSAVGLSGKITLGFEIDFEKKEVHVTKGKKDKVPGSTVNGIVQCAAREFASIPLEEVPHKFKHYTVQYGLTFYPPGKLPEGAEGGAENAEGEAAAGSTTSESEANGSATVAWDSAPVRKDPKDGAIVVSLPRGTKVKIVGKRNDWYKVEHGGKTGWIYRGALGL
jgi:hypothetical protein